MRCGAAAALTLAIGASAATVVDDRGRPVTLDHPPERIVTLAPHLAEVAFAAGAGDRVVGVSVFSDFPPEVARLPQIEASGRVDLERVVRLAPDLALAWRGGNRVQDLERLERLGIPVFATEARRLEDVARVLREVGKLTGNAARGEAAAEGFERSVNKLRERYRGRSPVRVFYEVWHEPLMTVSGDHLISKAIELCGGENIFAGLSILAPQVSLESVLVANPQAIIVGGKSEERQKWLQYWLKWDTIAAVKEGSVFVIDPDIIQRHSPRITQGIEQLCGYLDQVRAGLNGAGKAKEGQQE